MIVPLAHFVPAKGTLSLTGSGEYLPGMRPVDEALLARLDGPARVVCLPTGAGTEGDERIRYWMELGLGHFRALGVAEVQSLPVIDRASADDPALAEQVRAANFVYFSGGKPAYLMASLQETAVWAAVMDVLTRGGVAAGCSAGAMIFGSRVPTGMGLTDWQPGFGLLPDAVVLPHFDEFPGLMKSALGMLTRHQRVVGIDGYTALVCDAAGCRVIGQKTVTMLLDGHRQVYAPD